MPAFLAKTFFASVMMFRILGILMRFIINLKPEALWLFSCCRICLPDKTANRSNG
mgnify:CR=1 FL=1